jgi:probable F420-dependent oxidoreductase
VEIGIAYLGSPADAGPLAAEAEQAGADVFTCGETEHSAFGGCVAALLATSRITVGTSISIAFARSPMAAAMEAHSMLVLGPGRTFYGLGSQIRQVIERRFSAEFADPRGRLAEYAQIMRRAIDAIRGEQVEPFAGKYYNVSQFRFFGTPEPELAPLQLYLAAVGPKMTALAAQSFDGILGHAVATPGYIRSVVRPILGDRMLTSAVFTSVDEDRDAARERARWALAFYASTPAYEPALAHEGFGDLPTRLRASLRAEGRAATAALVTDEVLDRFVLVGSPEEVAGQLTRYEGIVDRVMIGGIGVGATRDEVVGNTRGLIDVAGAWTRQQGSRGNG